MSVVEGQIRDMTYMKEKGKKAEMEAKANGKWGKICCEERERSKARISGKKKDERGKLYKKRGEKPHSRDKCPHHGLEDGVTFLQHSSRP